MAIITAPTFLIKQITWTFDRPAQVNRSLYTGVRRVIANPWHGKWSAKVDLAVVQGETNFLAMRAFFAQLVGQINTFLLPATEGAQGPSDTTVASGGAQGSNTLVMAASATVTAGMYATVTLPSGNRQMVMITVSSTGTTLTFEPKLRESAAVGAAVVLSTPSCHVALDDSKFTWDVAVWRLYGLSFSVEEAF